MHDLEKLTTDEILEKLPNHLTLQRNSYAPESDRFRMYSASSQKSLADTGAASARECVLKYLAIEEKSRQEWTNQTQLIG